MAETKKHYTPSMSDDAVKAKTGRSLMGWFIILNKANASAMPHKDIARLLHDKGAPDWWAQMIAVEFERARGGRQKHERPDGFSVSVSKTIAAPLARLFAAVSDSKTRKKWFPEPDLTPSSETKNKYFRGSLKNGTRLEVGFYAKGAGKSQITVQVNKLAKKSDVERERARWKQELEKLEQILS